MFFREKDAEGSWIDYEAAASGELQLVPHGLTYEALADDYSRMLSDGMLLDDERAVRGPDGEMCRYSSEGQPCQRIEID